VTPTLDDVFGLPDFGRVDTGNVVELSPEWADRARATAIGGYWSKERKAWVVTNPDARTARAAITLFPHILAERPELAEVAESDLGDGARPTDFATELDLSLGLDSLGPGQLYPFQDRDAAYLAAIMRRDGERGDDMGAFVGWDRGLGKTAVTAAFIKHFGWQRTIVVCRNDTKVPVWYRQLAEEAYPGAECGWLPEHNVVVIPNEKAKREKMLSAIAEGAYDDAPLVWVIHYQAIPLIAGENRYGAKGKGDGWKRLGRWNASAYDEGHRLANYNPNSHKNPQFGAGLSRMRKQVDHALNLTGSFLNNKAEGMFGQLHYMMPHRYKAKWADFNDEYIDYVEVDGRKVAIGFHVDKLPKLRHELGVFTVYRKKEEVFDDLPELIHSNIELPMLPEQKRAYEEVRDQAWTTIEEKGVVASNPMALMHTLRRLATAWPGLETAKMQYALTEMLEAQPDEQFVVFTWYKDPGHLLAERLGDDVVVVDGDVAPRHRPELLRRHENGQARILVGSIATLGESLNLQYMHEAIRLDRDWDPEVNGQTIDRLHRNGQLARVTLHDLWTPHTVDTLKVMPNLRSKQIWKKALFT